jgi:hypothetical protein
MEKLELWEPTSCVAISDCGLISAIAVGVLLILK